MKKFRVAKVYSDYVEAETAEEAESLFDEANMSEDYTYLTVEINNDGNEIEDSINFL